MGRKDGQVKINGFRIELGEIEAVARKFYTVDNAIAIMDSKKKLALFYTGKEIEDWELQVHFEKYLPAYMIPYRFVYMEQFPLSKNGKIDRAALLQIRELKEESEISAPANEIEMKISVIWGKYLESDQVSVDENFFALGGDSIIAQRIAQELTKQFAVKIPFVKIVETGTVKELARFIQAETESKEEPKATLLSENQGEKTVEASQTELPMTNIQKAYFNGRNDSFELAHYNAHYYFEVEFPYEISDIERSIAQMLERHEVLRSIFLKNGTQKILADVPEYKVDITIAETEQEFAEKNEQMRRELSHKNYDFSKWPLFTFEVLKRAAAKAPGEMLGLAMEMLLDAGAADVWYTPIHMKKNRPAYMLSVLCRESSIEAMEEIILTQTTTIGIRRYPTERTILDRSEIQVETSYGPADVKVCAYKGRTFFYPEYESIRRICREQGVDFQTAYHQARMKAEESRQD